MDGFKGGVNYDAHDRFCLDGQRLVAINNGTYGSDGTEYRTERESFSKIVSYGSAGGGPAYFEVRIKGGQILQYGATEDSRIEAQGKTAVRLWALNKVQDRKGNYFTISYIEDNAGGEYRPIRIDYTGNANAGLTPYNSVQFLYGLRTDIPSRYEGGSVIKTSVRLTNIKTYADAMLVRDYRLVYSDNGIVNRSHLIGVIECGSDSVCLRPTIFDWQMHTMGDAAFNPSQGWFNTAYHPQVWVTDVNGDSLPDILGISDNYVGVQLNTGSGFSARTQWATSTFNPSDGWFDTSFHKQVWVTDVNGDGLPDILGITDNYVGVQLNTGSGFSERAQWATSTFDPSNGWFSTALHPAVWVIDVNGDGLADILGITDNYVGVQINTGSGFGPRTQWAAATFNPSEGWFSTAYHPQVWVTDVNGDNLPDILGITDNYVGVQLNTGSGFRERAQWATSTFNPSNGWFSTALHPAVWVTDVNGDGLVDILGITDNYVGVQINTGSSFGPRTQWASSTFNPSDGWFNTAYHPQVWVTDVSGDGLVDIVGIGDNYVGVQLNTGSGFGLRTQWASSTFNPSDGWFSTALHRAVWMTDVNADGLTDILGITDNYVGVQRNTGSGFSAREQVFTASGNSQYNPLTFSLVNGFISPTGSDLGSYAGWTPYIADFDGDGVSDILWDSKDSYGRSTGYREILLARNAFGITDSYGLFGKNINIASADGSYIGWSPHVGDFNGDGKADVLWDSKDAYGRSTGNRALWLSSFGPNVVYTTINNLSMADGSYVGWAPHIGDFNGDQRADILWDSEDEYGRSTGSRVLWLSLGDGTFTILTNIAGADGGYSGWAPHIADINGDGLADVLWDSKDAYGRSTGSRTLWLGKADGTFTVLSNLAGADGGYVGYAPHFTDFNGDGKTDILWDAKDQYKRSTGPRDIWMSKADGNFTVFPSIAAAAQTIIYSPEISDSPNLVIGDFNGDGLQDMLFHWGLLGSNQLYLSKGDGDFTTITNPINPATVEGVNRRILTTNPLRISWEPAGMIVGDFNGDGLADVFFRWEPSAINKLALSSSLFPDLLTGITEGLGATTKITYKPLTYEPKGLGIFYTKNFPDYPYLGIRAPIYVVASHTQSDGVGGARSFSYSYSGATAHLTGPGWLGFRSIQRTDATAGIKTTTDYITNYNGTHGLLSFVSTQTSVDFKMIQYFWTPVPHVSGKQVYPHLSGVLERTLGPSLEEITRTTTDYVCDDFGNQTSIVTNYNDGHTQTVTNTYTNDTVNWILGQLTQSQVTRVAPMQGPQTRTSTFSYESGTGLLTATTVEPSGGPEVALTTTYTYDSFGNRLTTTQSGTGVVSRTTTDVYDLRGQFVVSSTNALGHTETKVYDPKWGVMTSLTGPNNLTTTWEYDGFGRKTKETRADGTTTTISYQAEAGGYAVTTQSSGNPSTTVHYDILGRETRTETVGFDATVVYKDTQYDAAGRVDRVSRPYFAGQTPAWNVFTYDPMGRIKTVTAPNGGLTTYTYNGLSTTITNALNQARTEIKDAQGRLVQTTDALGNNTFYAYDPFGNLAKVTDALGNITAMGYDLRGRKTAMVDPDMGAWSYAYNPFGELVSQTDALGQATTITYDELGRMRTRTSLEGTSTWEYDTALKGVGKLTRVLGPNGYVQTYTYDDFGRTSRVQTQVNGEAYNVDTGYDALSRVDTLTYPQTGFRLKQIYNERGYLSEVRDAVTNLPYWRATNANAEGRVTAATLGNNLTVQRQYQDITGWLLSSQTGTVQNVSYNYDVLGNPISRSDAVHAYSEEFAYDALNRLTEVKTPAPAPKVYQYDAIGNITFKTGVGTYSYNPSGPGSVRPHAVAAVSGDVNATYTYDPNGNLLSGGGRDILYTSFNKPSQITANGETTTFTYDPNHARLTKTTPLGTTVYIGNLYERDTQGSLVVHKHHLYASGEFIALVTHRSDGQHHVRYVHSDALGSVTAITDEAGNRLEALSYDAYGKRRETNGGDATGLITSITHHGFTGHEHDDNAGLINMNARLYDPVLGRFLSADTVVPNPALGQTFNRYSYVNNSPLLYTDPTGHCTADGSGCFSFNLTPDFTFDYSYNFFPDFSGPFYTWNSWDSWMSPSFGAFGMPGFLSPLDFGFGTVALLANEILSGGPLISMLGNLFGGCLNGVDCASNRSGNFGPLFEEGNIYDVTSSFGMRTNSRTGKIEDHGGIDIGSPQGTLLISPITGKVEFAGDIPVGGYTLVIQGTGEYSSYKLGMQHLSQIFVTNGTTVDLGSRLGATGGMPGSVGAGDSRGIHLHFYIRQDGILINPAPYYR